MWNWKLYIFILMQWTKWFIFWNIFLYCKIINFLQLFLATCCLCILQTQLVFWYFFYFELIFLYVCKSWCITTRYYISHFLVHEDNKNTRKIKLLIKSVNQTLINFLFQIWICSEYSEYRTNKSTFISKKDKLYNFWAGIKCNHTRA